MHKSKKQNKQNNKKSEILFHLQYWFIDIHKTNTGNQIVTNYLPWKEYLPPFERRLPPFKQSF